MRVEPLKKSSDIRKIKALLKDDPRNLALFVVGINLNMRASDLIRLTAGQVRDIKLGDCFMVIEQKTKKQRPVYLNSACIEVIGNLLESKHFEDNDRLFRIATRRVQGLVIEWCRRCDIKIHAGSHTLRKTWAYWQRTKFNASLPMLMQALNHSRESQTLNYCCIGSEEQKNLFMNVI